MYVGEHKLLETIKNISTFKVSNSNNIELRFCLNSFLQKIYSLNYIAQQNKSYLSEINILI